MASFKNKDGKVIILRMIKVIQENKDYLSEIDGAIGDGDHGINMNKGFTLCEKQIMNKDVNLTQGLGTLGRTLMTDIGGSMGPLYGTFFRNMAKKAGDNEEIDETLFGEMLQAAFEGVQNLGDAQIGDKTLVDTLDPALKSYKEAVTTGKQFDEALAAMKSAAEVGWQSTRDMVAKLGRASRLGERSRGVLDPGATSCFFLITAMADSILELTS